MIGRRRLRGGKWKLGISRWKHMAATSALSDQRRDDERSVPPRYVRSRQLAKFIRFSHDVCTFERVLCSAMRRVVSKPPLFDALIPLRPSDVVVPRPLVRLVVSLSLTRATRPRPSILCMPHPAHLFDAGSLEGTWAPVSGPRPNAVRSPPEQQRMRGALLPAASCAVSPIGMPLLLCRHVLVARFQELERVRRDGLVAPSEASSQRCDERCLSVVAPAARIEAWCRLDQATEITEGGCRSKH